ncbi:hypothetical protein [Streptomyces sp. NPDC095817]|uniref:hypothetical protein n=1 Tax=Streptomyces sp. NPDC095817 TaxID=3155082 RepID=UPI00332417B9
MPNQEDLHLGASHADKIGRIVTVDVDGANGREIYTGHFKGAHDRFGPANDPESTTLYVGTAVVFLDWSDGVLTVLIEVETAAQ